MTSTDQNHVQGREFRKLHFFLSGLFGVLTLVGLVLFAVAATAQTVEPPASIATQFWHVFLLKVNQTPPNLKFLFLFLPFAGLVAIFIRQLQEGVRATLWLILLGITVVWLMSSFSDGAMAWGWLLAAIPAMLVVHHGLYLGLIKPRFVSRDFQKTLSDFSLKESVAANDRYFEPGHLALRYGLSALGILIVGLTIFACLNPVNQWALDTTLVNKNSQPLIKTTTLDAARFGAMGAYLYILLYLGQRGFRHDITSGAALWCAVTLALGPLLAAALSEMWASSNGTSDGWTTQAMYFAAGMAPRHIARQVEQFARRFAGASKPNPIHSVSLTTLSGITQEVEERLFEEGIYDVGGLAASDPLRLNRSTNFDKTQILTWIDAAILIYTLPGHWEELKKKGVRGILDLVWYKGREEALKGLANNDESLQMMLSSVISRMHEDPQVRSLGALYTLNENTLLALSESMLSPYWREDRYNIVRRYSTLDLARLIKQITSDPVVSEHIPAGAGFRSINIGADSKNRFR